jgi:hypothetical protein
VEIRIGRELEVRFLDSKNRSSMEVKSAVRFHAPIGPNRGQKVTSESKKVALRAIKTDSGDLPPQIRTKLSMISHCGKGRSMSKSRHTEAQMIGALKQLEVGRKAEDVARETGVSFALGERQPPIPNIQKNKFKGRLTACQLNEC